MPSNVPHRHAQALTALPATLDTLGPYLDFVENFGTHLPNQLVFGGSVTTSSFLARLNLTVGVSHVDDELDHEPIMLSSHSITTSHIVRQCSTCDLTHSPAP